jgi:hypothetical protein
MLTFSFFKYRLVRKQEELMMLLERVNLVSNFNIKQLQSRIEKEYAPGDYIMPVMFISLLTMFGMFLLFLSWAVYELNDDNYSSILFSGSDFWTKSSIRAVEKRSVSVIAFSIMGSYISASQYIYRRFSTIDLTPGNFFSVGLRTIMAAVVSLMLSFLFNDTPVDNSNMILVIAFLTGIFPDSGFRMLLEKVKIFPTASENAHRNYPLDCIEGISEMHKIRLNEVGIDNVQNLAQFNFIMLIVKTPFPVRTLLDWTAQAKLMIEFQDDFMALQKAGIRTAIDLIDACHKPERIALVATECGISQLALEINYQNMMGDQSVRLLDHFRHNLEHFQLDK